MQVGFDAGDGENFFAVPGSQSPDILHIGNSTNFDTVGRWIFRIDEASVDSGGCQVAGNQALRPSCQQTYSYVAEFIKKLEVNV